YENYHESFGGSDSARKSNYTDMVNKYYDLVTSFYEYGWGESFHFAHRMRGETLRESIKRHEHFLALRLGLGPGMKVLDVGCGIGGPLREIALFSGATVTGLNNNEYQISRGKVLNRRHRALEACGFIKADFMSIPVPDASFDAVYAIEATCHAPDAVGCYSEVKRVLKPGQCFAAYEWCLTDAYDPNNPQHQEVKREVELGNGLPDIRTTAQVRQALQDAGFELLEAADLTETAEVSWHTLLPLCQSRAPHTTTISSPFLLSLCAATGGSGSDRDGGGGMAQAAGPQLLLALTVQAHPRRPLPHHHPRACPLTSSHFLSPPPCYASSNPNHSVISCFDLHYPTICAVHATTSSYPLATHCLSLMPPPQSTSLLPAYFLSCLFPTPFPFLPYPPAPVAPASVVPGQSGEATQCNNLMGAAAAGSVASCHVMGWVCCLKQASATTSLSPRGCTSLTTPTCSNHHPCPLSLSPPSHLPLISPSSPPHLPLISPSSPPHLPLISPSCAQVPSIHLVDGVQAPMEAKWAHGVRCTLVSNQHPWLCLISWGPALHLSSCPQEWNSCSSPLLMPTGAQHPPGGRSAGAHGGQGGAQGGTPALYPVPSIHLVDGVQAPMEAKFAYVNVANSTRKSVFSVFLKLHPRDKDNAWLNLWLKDIPTAVNGTTKIAAKTNFLELLSFETPFWYYEGSQVHPPCTETVDWFISMRPKFVSTRQ
ncbi:unnamed protein product, partial [Closterium sp. NIES-53]